MVNHVNPPLTFTNHHDGYDDWGAARLRGVRENDGDGFVALFVRGGWLVAPCNRFWIMYIDLWNYVDMIIYIHMSTYVYVYIE